MKEGNLSVKHLCEFFWKIEKDYDLLNMKIDGVYIWQYIRMPLYYRLATLAGVLEQPHTFESASTSKKLLSRAKFILHSVASLKSLRYLRNKYDVIVLEHDRTVLIDGNYRDLYTYKLRKENHSNNKILSLRFPFGTTYLKNDDTNDALDISWLLLVGGAISDILPSTLSKFEKSVINKIQRRIELDLEVKLELNKYISKYLRRYKIRSFFLKKIFNSTNATQFISVTPYSGRGDFLGAAKELGIHCKEVQHGIISYYHLGYSFPHLSKKIDNNIYPDEILSWGPDWNLGSKFLPGCYLNNNVVTYPQIETISELSSKFIKDEKTLTVVSQGAHTDRIAHYIIENMEYLKDYNINYKLHPSEYFVKNVNLEKLESYSNVVVLRDENLLQLFSTSSIVIGVFSTGLIEAKIMGCKVVILPFTGSEYFERESGYHNFDEVFL